MASQAQAAMWDELRAYAMGGASGNVTEARAQRAFRTARMVESRAGAESAQERLAMLREQRGEAQQRRTERQADRAARDARTAQAAQSRLARQEQTAADAARNQRIGRARGISRFVSQHAPDRVQRAGARLRSLPTPGGLGGVIAALLFFNLAIVPVGNSGQTRLYLLWQVLTGAVALPTPSAPPSPLEQAVNGVAADVATAGAVAGSAASTAGAVAASTVLGGTYIPPQLIPPFLIGGVLQ